MTDEYNPESQDQLQKCNHYGYSKESNCNYCALTGKNFKKGEECIGLIQKCERELASIFSAGKRKDDRLTKIDIVAQKAPKK